MQKFLVSFVILILSVGVNAESKKEAKPSFNCAKATTESEKLICNDESGELQRLDRLYSKLYFQVLNAIPKTKQGRETRKQMRKFAKAFMDYRDNMRCFFLAYNDDEKEVREVLGGENDDSGLKLHNRDAVHYGLKPHHYNQCVARVYKMGILLLATNTIKDYASIKEDSYFCDKDLILDIFSIKGLEQFKLYDKIFPEGYETSLTEAAKTLQGISSNGRYSGYGWCYEKDEGFVCTNAGCAYDLDVMRDEVLKPLDEFIEKLN